MTINLSKGERISLEKVAPGLVQIFIGLGWDINVTDTGGDFDIDASIFLLDSNDKLISEQHFIFYNNPKSPDPEQSIQQRGDNRTGAGEGDDEIVDVNLKSVPPEVVKMALTV
ncbi:MAG: TerD family protein, partial [Hydrococcus sp. SU_1_0]|nr:TerD family protein [Hydrococcus sp. SU_1_0]